MRQVLRSHILQGCWMFCLPLGEYGGDTRNRTPLTFVPDNLHIFALLEGNDLPLNGRFLQSHRISLHITPTSYADYYSQDSNT
jgi:hypothetical protein